jgi:hypothetical protein
VSDSPSGRGGGTVENPPEERGSGGTPRWQGPAILGLLVFSVNVVSAIVMDWCGLTAMEVAAVLGSANAAVIAILRAVTWNGEGK